MQNYKLYFTNLSKWRNCIYFLNMGAGWENDNQQGHFSFARAFRQGPICLIGYLVDLVTEEQHVSI